MNGFKKNEDAVSPVIATIMMVVITVILAAIIGTFAFGMVGSMKKTPVASFEVKNNPGTPIVGDIRIIYMAGDSFDVSAWQISIQPSGGTTIFNTGSTMLVPGDVIIANSVTKSTTIITTNISVAGGDAVLKGNYYNVVLKDIGTNTILLDTVVIVT